LKTVFIKTLRFNLLIKKVGWLEDFTIIWKMRKTFMIISKNIFDACCFMKQRGKTKTVLPIVIAILEVLYG